MTLALALPAAVLWTLMTKLPQAWEMARQPGGYDNDNPRAQAAALDARGARAVAAHANAWEALLLHSLGLLAASSQGVEGPLVLALAWGWFPIRLLYTWIYLQGRGSLRSTVWTLGLLCSLGLMLLAAMA